MRHRTSLLAAVAAAFLATACDTDDRARTVDTDIQPGAEQQGQAMQPAQPAEPAMRIEIVLAERMLHVYRDGQRTDSHPVAVGSEEWPTRTGEWTIDEVILNPRWVPPEEEWAEDEEVAEPGADDNPLGVAQLIYDRPRSIHGTDAPQSIGQAVSHGSIRVTNDVAMRLAREVAQAGGAQDFAERAREAEQNPNREVHVRVPDGVPIRVR